MNWEQSLISPYKTKKKWYLCVEKTKKIMSFQHTSVISQAKGPHILLFLVLLCKPKAPFLWMWLWIGTISFGVWQRGVTNGQARSKQTPLCDWLQPQQRGTGKHWCSWMHWQGKGKHLQSTVCESSWQDTCYSQGKNQTVFNGDKAEPHLCKPRKDSLLVSHSLALGLETSMAGTEPVAAGSDHGQVSSPIRQVGNTSVMTYLRRE